MAAALWVFGACAADGPEAPAPAEQKVPSKWLKDSGPVSTGKFFSVAAQDLDGDGHVDLAAGAENPAGVAVWYGGKDGAYADYRLLPVKGNVRGIAAGDLDKDGLRDLVFAINGEGMGLQPWFQKKGREWKQGNSISDLSAYETVLCADVNRDGSADVVAANATSEESGGVQVWFNNGKGDWITETGPFNINKQMGVAAGDFDEDGKTDLATAGQGAYGALRVWLGDGAGGWSSSPAVIKGDFFRLNTGDINGDGHSDLLAGTFKQGIRVLHGNGKGGFSPGPTPASSGSFHEALSLDVNGDGRMDIVAGSVDGAGIKCWLQNKAGAWEELSGRFPDKGVFYGVLLKDTDSDRRPDLLAASWGEGVKRWAGAAIRGETQAMGPPRTTLETLFKAPPEPSENSVFKMVNGIPEYRVGFGDVLKITWWRGIESENAEVRVQPDGTVSFGLLDNVPVAGLAQSELNTKLTTELQRYIRNPRIEANVKEFNSKRFALYGAIMVHSIRQSGPGVYALAGRSSVMEMLARYGGPRDDANLRKVTLQRKNGQVFTLDLYKAIVLGDRKQDMLLDDGDVVNVPTVSMRKKRIYVLGEVKQPGLYPYNEEIDVLEAVMLAGGFTNHAKPAETRIIRGDMSRPEILPVDMRALLKKADHSQNILLASRDVVYVPRTVVGDMQAFIAEISPILNFLLYPATFRSAYMYDDALRFDIGGEKTQDQVIIQQAP
jgi:protein involved in polysaccharide export with SLBB domain